MSKKKISTIAFWIIYLLCVLAFIIFWARVISSVKKNLIVYESCQPERTVEAVVTMIQSGDISMMDFASSENRFEDGNTYRDNYAASISGKLITYAESTGSFDVKNPEYDILADGEKVATVTISETSSEPLMFILSKQEWALTSVVPIYEIGNESATIIIPASCTAYINGVELNAGEQVGEPTDYSGFEYEAAYVTVPKQITYAVSGLMATPTVTVKNASGSEIPYTVDGATYTVDLKDACSAGEISQELSDYVLKNAKNWSDFFSTDLAGSQSSTKCIEYMFPAGSDYIALAENYRLHDMWMYSGHATPTFANESVTNYIQYTDDMFSVDIYFEKTMYLTRTGENRTDITHATHYYVNIDGTWLIADMIDILDTEAQ